MMLIYLKKLMILISVYDTNNKVKINKEIEDLAFDMGLHPVQAQKLVAFLDKRYNFTPDLATQQKVSDDEKQIRETWNELMNQVIFTKEPTSENKKTIKP